MFERNWLYYLLFYLKILFIYNFYISLFFNNTTLWWIWLIIIPFETAEEVGLTILSDHGEGLIIETYDNREMLYFDDPTSQAKRYVLTADRTLTKMLKKSDYSMILFNRRDREYIRYFVPNQWNHWRINDYGCFSKNNYFFKYKLFLRRYFGYYNYTVYLNFLLRIDQPRMWWIMVHAFTTLYTCNYRVFKRWNPEKKNKKVIKKYKFK